MAITPVSSMNATAGVGTTAFSITTTTVGNAVALGCGCDASTPTISSLSGGGCTWTRIGGPYVSTGFGSTTELWLGVVTSVVTGSTVTAAYSSSVTGDYQTFVPQELTAGLGAGTVWSVHGSAVGQDNAAGLTIGWAFPAAAAGDFVFGKGSVSTGTPGTTGIPAGLTYKADSASNDPWFYGSPAAAATSAAQNNSAMATSATLAALITASLPSLLLPGPRVPRVAAVRSSY